MAEVKILKCNCESKYQDEKYGQNKRLHNKCVKEGTYRCSICEKVNNG